jgi:uncharacterized protein YndB with AHSA1/START domain
MASASREYPVPPHRVFEVLLDPLTYPSWLAGASDIRDVDDDWPAVGSRFHHRVGVGPLKIADHTELLEVQPDRLLRLAVRARPLVAATATFSVVGDGQRCVVTFEEEPTLRLIGNVVRPLLDPMTHVRNHVSLKRLEPLVAARHA